MTGEPLTSYSVPPGLMIVPAAGSHVIVPLTRLNTVSGSAYPSVPAWESVETRLRRCTVDVAPPCLVGVVAPLVVAGSPAPTIAPIATATTAIAIIAGATRRNRGPPSSVRTRLTGPRSGTGLAGRDTGPAARSEPSELGPQARACRVGRLERRAVLFDRAELPRESEAAARTGAGRRRVGDVDPVRAHAFGELDELLPARGALRRRQVELRERLIHVLATRLHRRLDLRLRILAQRAQPAFDGGAAGAPVGDVDPVRTEALGEVEARLLLRAGRRGCAGRTGGAAAGGQSRAEQPGEQDGRERPAKHVRRGSEPH